jgi:histidine triad (HIT) family protein
MFPQVTATTRNNGCVFCAIVAGTAPAHIVWEDDEHLAFLSIFPNTPGVTVVIPRQHHPSYVAALPADVAGRLHTAAIGVARLLDDALGDVARTAIIYEGYGVDHVHAKLYPLHGTAGNDGERWQPVHSKITTYFDRYQGYVSSHDSDRAPDDELAKLATTIRTAQPKS